ncbi:DMT family transporter [Xanthobacter variabilis]|uniref:DMT family transporter n=1 Tax=Xanthobacter variabilis TaxID=3119932 RepID=UPI00374E7416
MTNGTGVSTGPSGAPGKSGAASMAVKGVIAMALAMAMFITNDTCLKMAVREIPLGEAIFLRTLLSAAIILALVARAGDLAALPMVLRPRVLARAGLDALTTFIYVAALAVMPIASSTTIYMVAPLMTTALAVPMLGEKVSWRSWCAIIIGFCGALIVTRPDPATFSAVALLPALAAFCGAARDVMTRGIGMEIPGSVVGVSSTFVLIASAGSFALWESWHGLSLQAVGLVLLAGAAFAAGTLLLVFAFRHAPVASVSPLRYLMVFGALVSGFLVFGDLPDAWTSIGMVLVVGAGLYAITAEHRRSVMARRAASGCGNATLGAAVACAPSKD